ncbi:type II toxin-antitoxin system VapC family toxin [Acaryochloris marina]|uniref:type II toxin-antitoxin system VapC family toxin n=1 Tax=Acaryochloris marina TaxID=155978 RepID=UPI0021C280C4|nr:type II toxin-antitoxin system VapC family toxin [Acaryochloris marina]BDM77784.1 twitching motility protein PilT [Acaryochloris marina MBIC10699]
MRALLDTHTFLWWNTNDAQLSAAARQFIENSDHILLLSVVSVWEIVIKYKLGQLPLPESPEIYIPKRLEYYQFQILPVHLPHVLRIAHLAPHHNDSFDRLLIAQSQMEKLAIITVDKKIQQYSVEIIW